MSVFNDIGGIMFDNSEKINQLQAENAMLREALEWYADVKTYEKHDNEPILGFITVAQQALTQSPSTWLQEKIKAVRVEERGRIVELLENHFQELNNRTYTEPGDQEEHENQCRDAQATFARASGVDYCINLIKEVSQ